VNWLFAGAFLGSHFVRGPTIIQRMLGENVSLEASDWSRLSLAWVAFFVFSGTLNLYVAYNYPEGTWVNFKLFGLMGLTLAFAVAQGFWIARKGEQTEQTEAEKT
jgi:intracellular septation protein